MKSCKTCKWYEPAKQYGMCRLNPPTNVVKGKNIDRFLVAVLPTDWCSHHKAKR